MLMKKFLILLVCILSVGIIQAQTVTLSGSVLSATDNQPVPVVSIVVMGTTVGTSTSIDADFSLESFRVLCENRATTNKQEHQGGHSRR